MEETCDAHPAKAKAATCFECMRSLCVVCVRIDGVHDYCKDCFERRTTKRQRRRTLVVGIVTTAVLALVVWTWLFGNPLRFGADTFAVRDLAAAVEREPCQKAKVLELAETYLRLGAPRECLALTDGYLSKCGEWPRLRWARFTAHKRLSEYEKAVEEATKLIDSEPYDHDYWWWRAQANEEAGKLEAAADDYRQALIIQPKLTNIPFNLAAVYERLGRPCDAIWPVEQFLSAHPEHLDNRNVQAQLDRYYADEKCKVIRGTGKHTLRFAPNAHVIIAEILVDDVKGRFIVDTGATFVALTPKFAARAGLTSAPSTKIALQTAGGLRFGKLIHTRRVQLGGVAAHRVPAVIMDDDLGGVDGLLGMSFLSRFSVHLDQGTGTLTLSQR